VSDAVLAIINGRARGVDETGAREALRSLLAAMLPGARIVFTDDRTEAGQLARKAVSAGTRMIVAGGGDGTINAVASALVGTDTVLGLLPLGTFNHFARDLKIPAGQDDAARVLAEGNVACVDVGEVNGRVFVNNSGLGLYPATVLLREYRQRSGITKWPAFVWAAAKALARYHKLGIRIRVDGQELLRRTPVVFVGNNRYEMEGLRAGTRASLASGELCLYVPRPRGRWHLVWFSVLALLGRVQGRDDFDYLFADRFRIESSHGHLRVSLDGEVTTLATPLEYRIRPGALKVAVPAPIPAGP
jgi:diacylglycerol kinase family enzyme